MTTSRPIAIIGAGIGGLTAALALRQVGFSVAIYEAAEQLGEVGAGLTLSKGAQSVLRHLGLYARLVRFASPSVTLPFVHNRTGAILAGKVQSFDPPEVDEDIIVARQCHRADLHALLVAALDIPVHLGHRLTMIEQSSDTARAIFANGDTVDADAIIAADGVRSVARAQLWGESTPRFAGQIAYRFLVDRADAENFLEHGRGAVFLGPRATFNRYLLRGGSVLNCVGIVASDLWIGEGWQTPASREEMRHSFAGWHPQVAGLIDVAYQPIKWGLFDHPPLSCWRNGRATLLGDAAHAMLPFLGMGAAMAIEDGMILARALAMESSVEGGLDRYEAARRPRTALVHTKSIKQGRLTQARDPENYDHSAAPAADPALLDYDPVTAPV